MNTPPQAITQDLVVLLGNTINGLNLITGEDADGDAITRWRFIDTFGGAFSGFFEVNGIRRDANSVINLSTAELSSLEYISGSRIGRESIRVQVFDGKDWSKSAEFFIYSATANDERPILNAFPFRVTAYEKINVIGWINGSDPDGHPLDRYKFRNRKVGGGYFQLDGVKLREGTGNGDADWIYVQAKDLPRLQYVGALNGQQEVVDMRVRDGKFWSNVRTIIATTEANTARPDVVEGLFKLPRLVTRPMEEFVVVTDPNENSIKKYRIYDTSNDPRSAYFSVRGIQQDFKTWIELSPEDYRNSTITSGSVNRQDRFRVRGWDGKFWSPIETVTIQTDNKPSLEGINLAGENIDVYNSYFERRRIIGNFIADPAGDFFQDYQVIDRQSNEDGSPTEFGGRLLLRPTPDRPNSLSDNRIHTLSPGDLNELIFQGGFVTALDEILIRGFNGKYWSDWERLIFRTDSGWNTAGITWLQQPTPFNSIVPYSFGGFHRQDDRDVGGVQAPEYTGLSFDAREAFRRQFARLNALVENVQFVEVPDSYIDPIAQYPHGLIRIQGWIPDDFDQPLPCAFSFGPSDHSDTTTLQEGGDIWITHAGPGVSLCGGGDWSVDSVNNAQVSREIMSAIGIGGSASGDAAFSLARGPDPRGQAPPGFVFTGLNRTFGLWDIHAMQTVYGADVDTNITDTVYDFDNYWDGATAFVDHIYDTGGDDTLDLSGATVNGFVSILEGDVGQMNAGSLRIGITYGSVIENFVADEGNQNVRGNEVVNTIRTGAGNDTIQSFGENDFMFGGAGSDNYIWSLADGSDTIDEERMAGRDRITIERSETMRLNDLAEDVEFRREGRDLLIDFPVNGEYSQGQLRIVNQRWGGSRIETLNIFGIDVDISNAFFLTSTTGSRFNIDMSSPPSVFGFALSPA